jgi:hypothetical protein
VRAVIDAGEIAADPQRLAGLQLGRQSCKAFPLLYGEAWARKFQCRHLVASLSMVLPPSAWPFKGVRTTQIVVAGPTIALRFWPRQTNDIAGRLQEVCSKQQFE